MSIPNDPPRTFLYAGLRASCKLDRPTMGSYVYNEVYDQLNAGTVIQIDAAHGCAFLIKRTALERVKGFDPKFFAVHEEVDLSMRIREAGYQIVSVSHARIFHKVGATFGASSPSRTYYDVRNKVHYFSNRATAQKRRLLPSFWIFYIVA